MHSMLLSMLFLTDNPLDGALRLIYFVCCCCCCCCTSFVQLKSLKLCKSVLPKDIKMPTATLTYPPVHLSADAVAGIDPQYLLTFCKELHALARTATADCSMPPAQLANLADGTRNSVSIWRRREIPFLLLKIYHVINNSWTISLPNLGGGTISFIT